MKKLLRKRSVELSLALILFLVFIGYNLLSCIALTSVASNNAMESLLDSALHYSQQIIFQANANLDEYIREYKLLLTALSKNAYLIRRITQNDSLTMEDKLYLERQFKVYLDHIMSSKTDTAGLLIVGTNGYLYTDDARAMLNTGYDFCGSEWFRRTLAFDDKDILDISVIDVDFYQRHSALYGKQITTLSYPVWDYDGTKIGVIYCFLDTQSLQKSMYLSSMEGFSGVFMMNQNHEIVLTNDPKKINTTLEGSVFHATDKTIPTIRELRDQGDNLMHISTSSQYVKADVVCSIDVSSILGRNQRYRTVLLQRMIPFLLLSVVLGVVLLEVVRVSVKRLMGDLASTQPQFAFQPGNYHIRELNQIADEFSSLLSDINALNRRNNELQHATRLARMNTLMAQMNPHFLFNTLQLLQTELTCGDPDRADLLVVSLSRLLRYATNRQCSCVPLQDELDFASDYVNICRFKYASGLQYNVFCPAELRGFYVPKYLLQPLIENSFVHGFDGAAQEMALTVTASSCMECIAITVVDNGKGISPEQLTRLREKLRETESSAEDETSVGLQNIQRRIRLLYGDKYGLTVSSQAGSYAKIDILLPKEEERHEIADC